MRDIDLLRRSSANGVRRDRSVRRPPPERRAERELRRERDNQETAARRAAALDAEARRGVGG
jgi:hypothetical protein